jgi:hypothetical protein
MKRSVRNTCQDHQTSEHLSRRGSIRILRNAIKRRDRKYIFQEVEGHEILDKKRRERKDTYPEGRDRKYCIVARKGRYRKYT